MNDGSMISEGNKSSVDKREVIIFIILWKTVIMMRMLSLYYCFSYYCYPCYHYHLVTLIIIIIIVIFIIINIIDILARSKDLVTTAKREAVAKAEERRLEERASCFA